MTGHGMRTQSYTALRRPSAVATNARKIRPQKGRKLEKIKDQSTTLMD
jgi:hypothetical protein